MPVEPSPAPSDPTEVEDVGDYYGAGCGVEDDTAIVRGHCDDVSWRWFVHTRLVHFREMMIRIEQCGPPLPASQGRPTIHL